MAVLKLRDRKKRTSVMTRATIRASLVLAALVLYPGFPSADPTTFIFFTMNHDQTLYPGTDCIGIVATETMLANPNNHVKWKVLSGHGDSMSQDACTDMGLAMNKTNVQLVFKDAGTLVEGSTLTSDANGNIMGTVAPTSTPGVTPHKYFVTYKMVKAGPDPEIDVDCGPGCGPPPPGGTK
jgi:hypothetical protein